jgi:metal-responsive CopG/Arc/MetJ family transcriptional regulator
MAKIAISLPDKTLEEIEKERFARGESRSQFVRRAVEAYFRQKQEKEWEAQYIQGYLDMPETEEDLGGLLGLGLGALADEPWDKQGGA